MMSMSYHGRSKNAYTSSLEVQANSVKGTHFPQNLLRSVSTWVCFIALLQ
jgi:hypothetical protein